MKLRLLILLLLPGCVPLMQYQDLEKKLSAHLAQRDAITRELVACEERNKNLKEALKEASKARPVKTITVPADKIDQAELDAIKRKALSDTERKYQLRTRRRNK